MRAAQDGLGESKLDQLPDFEQSPLFTERERVALHFAEAITLDPTLADDALWAQLHAHFSEPDIVELGRFCSLLSGGIRWVHTLGVQHMEVLAENTTGLAPALVNKYS